MPTVEEHVRSLLQAGQFSWLPADLGAPPTGAPPQHPQLAPGTGLRAPGMLAERRQLSDLVLYLDGSYQAEYERSGEIDEREFLTTDFGALASPRMMLGAGGASAAAAAGGGGGATPVQQHAPPGGAGAGATPVSAEHGGGVPMAAATAAAAMLAKPPLAPPPGLRRPLALGLQSPLPIMHLGPPAPATPITQAMGSVMWLHGVTRAAGAEPSAALQQLLDAAGPDAAAVLAARVREAADAVFGSLPPQPQPPARQASGGANGMAASSGGAASSGSSGDGSGGGAAAATAAPGAWQAGAPASLHASVAQERRQEGLQLYWVALEAMLRAEEARCGAAGAAALATRWAFHACLLALSFEMVAASYRMGALCFPAIPERLGLAPFDLTKIIPAFVRALPTMPRELKRHLFTVEEKVVECLGWQAGSSLYAVLRAAVGDEDATAAAAAGGEGKQQQGAGGKGAPTDGAPASDAAAAPDQQQQPARQQSLAADGSLPTTANSGSGAASGASQPAPSSSGSPSGDEPSSKRQRGTDGSAVPVAPPAPAPGAAAAPLPHALGPPPEAGGPANAGGGDPGARAVMHDFCRKVLKLSAFRLVAIRWEARAPPLPRRAAAPPPPHSAIQCAPALRGIATPSLHSFRRRPGLAPPLRRPRRRPPSEGLDFAPMERDDVLAAVHEVVSHALYSETHLLYGRHLDQARAAQGG
jgi:retinoblastoma-like protein 1